MNKEIRRIEHPRQKHWVGDGFHVAQYMPGYGRKMSNDTSPFLMLDYNTPMVRDPDTSGHRAGVGFHPHRGFETVTLVYDGEVEHQDTAGNGGVIGVDEVQWMTAGSGLLHNEFFTHAFMERGGAQHFVQLWVNLPKSEKMHAPRYQALTKENIPNVPVKNGNVRIIAGSFAGVSAKTETFSPIELYDIRLDGASQIPLHFPDGYNAMILVIEGEPLLNEKKFHEHDMAYFSLSGNDILLETDALAKVLVMAGKPLDEPVFQYGPFVMTNESEIIEAINDFNAGKMGIAPETFE